MQMMPIAFLFLLISSAFVECSISPVSDLCNPEVLTEIPRPILVESEVFEHRVKPCISAKDLVELVRSGTHEIYYFGEFRPLHSLDVLSVFHLEMHIAFRYRFIELMGVTLDAKVVKAFDHKMNKYVALKLSPWRYRNQVYREYDRLRQTATVQEDHVATACFGCAPLTHTPKFSLGLDFIAQPSEFFRFKEYSVMAYTLPSGTIDDVKHWTWKGLKKFARGILQALACMSENNLVHYQVKRQNILLYAEDDDVTCLSDKVTPRLGDFGLVALKESPGEPERRTFSTNLIHRLGIRSSSITEDVSSLGYILMKITLGRILKPREFQEYARTHLQSLKPKRRKEQLISFIARCITPPRRLSPRAALKEPFLSD